MDLQATDIFKTNNDCKEAIIHENQVAKPLPKISTAIELRRISPTRRISLAFHKSSQSNASKRNPPPLNRSISRTTLLKAKRKVLASLECKVGVIFTSVNNLQLNDGNVNLRTISKIESLRYFITSRDLGGLKSFLDQNIATVSDIFADDSSRKESATSLACTLGLIDVLQIFHDRNLLQTSKDGGGYNPVHRAVYSQRIDVLKFLVDCFDENALSEFTQSGFNSLHIAASLGHLEMVKYLAKLVSDIDAHCEKGWNALHIACHAGFLEVSRPLSIMP